MTCSVCDKTMPLNKFAKSQRRGDGECYDCVAERTGAKEVAEKRAQSIWAPGYAQRVAEMESRKSSNNNNGKDEKKTEAEDGWTLVQGNGKMAKTAGKEGQEVETAEQVQDKVEADFRDDKSHSSESDVVVEDSDSEDSIFSL